ncbi:hypothetical protein INR49_009615 [Caranx melampygus]|nr:hypothetical protein INR49_009615 [Caranx melampygus]
MMTSHRDRNTEVLYTTKYLRSTLFMVAVDPSSVVLTSVSERTPINNPGRGVAFTLYLAGCRTTPNFPSRLGRAWPGGTERVKRCRIHDRKRKSSILAKASPRHTLIPTPNGRPVPSLFKKRPVEDEDRDVHQDKLMCRVQLTAPTAELRPQVDDDSTPLPHAEVPDATEQHRDTGGVIS